jgi:hypothetical protein
MTRTHPPQKGVSMQRLDELIVDQYCQTARDILVWLIATDEVLQATAIALSSECPAIPGVIAESRGRTATTGVLDADPRAFSGQ